MPRIRPIEEIFAGAQVHVRANAVRTWLVDAEGVEYWPPPWLVRLLSAVEQAGIERAQGEMRAALGLEDTDVLTPAEQQQLAAETDAAVEQIVAADGPDTSAEGQT